MFVYSQSFQRWFGPVQPGQPIYTGDIVFTTPRGEGELILTDMDGNERATQLFSESLFHLEDVPKEPDQSWGGSLRRGAAAIYDAVLGDSTPKPQGPYFSSPTVVMGGRGTTYTINHDESTNVSEVSLYSGVVDVWPVDDESAMVTLSPGQSVSSDDFEIQDADSAFDDPGVLRLPQDYWKDVPEEPINPDLVVPQTTSYSGDVTDGYSVDDVKLPRSKWWLWAIIMGAGLYGYSAYRQRKQD